MRKRNSQPGPQWKAPRNMLPDWSFTSLSCDLHREAVCSTRETGTRVRPVLTRLQSWWAAPPPASFSEGTTDAGRRTTELMLSSQQPLSLGQSRPLHPGSCPRRQLPLPHFSAVVLRIQDSTQVLSLERLTSDWKVSNSKRICSGLSWVSDCDKQIGFHGTSGGAWISSHRSRSSVSEPDLT